MNIRLLPIGGSILGLLMFSSPMTAQTHRQKADPCKDTSNMTQGEMNDCAVRELHKAESKLERLLNQLGITKDSPEQKAWEAYRNAQLAAIYPQEDISSYGSVYPTCLSILKKTLTEGRIRDLKALVTREGDVCNGYKAPSRKSD